jgi:hypothetical protein
MRRVRLVTDGSIVGHVEFHSFSPAGHPDYQCIPDGVLSDLDAQALAEALDRGRSWGGWATVTGKPFSKPPPRCCPGRRAVPGGRASGGGLERPTPFPPSWGMEEARASGDRER